MGDQVKMPDDYVELEIVANLPSMTFLLVQEVESSDKTSVKRVM
jgi:hypothetical protein